jgi:hypothetical protein
MNKETIIYVVITGLVLWFGQAWFDKAYGMEDEPNLAQQVVIDVNDFIYYVHDEYKDALEAIIPHPNISLYAKKNEIGIEWRF